VNRRLALTLGALGLLSTLGAEIADARPVRFGGGGGVYIGGRGSVSVGWSSPPRHHYPRASGWSVGGHIHIGGSYSYPRYRYYRPYYYPAYVPSYYGVTYYGSSYYPVDPAPAAPGVVAVVAPPPALPKLGIGLFAGGVSVEGVDESSDMGILGRIRLGNGGLLIEGELGKQSYADDLRVDRRLGASLVWEIGARNRLAPYLLAGLGVQQAEVADEFTTTQNFAELGIGLRYAITPRVHLAADIRAGSRDTMSSDSPETLPAGTTARMISPPSSDSPDDNEGYTRG
jgi:hypothetical protein